MRACLFACRLVSIHSVSICLPLFSSRSSDGGPDDLEYYVAWLLFSISVAQHHCSTAARPMHSDGLKDQRNCRHISSEKHTAAACFSNWRRFTCQSTWRRWWDVVWVPAIPNNSNDRRSNSSLVEVANATHHIIQRCCYVVMLPRCVAPVALCFLLLFFASYSRVSFSFFVSISSYAVVLSDVHFVSALHWWLSPLPSCCHCFVVYGIITVVIVIVVLVHI